jgi:D-alanine-D-alanine ligase
MRSGEQAAAALAAAGYEVIDVIVSPSGEWLTHGFARTPAAVVAAIDLLYIALHSSSDVLQAAQQIASDYRCPYTGSHAFPTRVAGSKALTKSHLPREVVRTPQHVRITTDTPLPPLVASARERLGQQLVVKPDTGGSSAGVEICTDVRSLTAHVEALLAEYPAALVEEQLVGREVTCGVLEHFRGQEHYALPPVMVTTASETPYYTHQEKRDGTATLTCPAPLRQAEKEALESIAKTVHQTLGLRHFSRSDFILTEDGPHLLEVNTHPALYAGTPYSAALSAVGSSSEECIPHLASMAALRSLV